MKSHVLKIFLLLSFGINAQSLLPDLSGVVDAQIKLHWGDLSIQGTNEDIGSYTATYTNTNNVSRIIAKNEVSNFISISVIGSSLFIETREPKGFESIDLSIQLPSRIKIIVEAMKGGEVSIHNFENGIEVNQLNGSFTASEIGSYALVNLANGSIDISFSDVDKKLPISLVTMNGEVKVTLPKDCKRDVRLISRKNGYVMSDFELTSVESIPNLNVANYSKNSIVSRAGLNGGGGLLFLSTENGPLIIRKKK